MRLTNRPGCQTHTPRSVKHLGLHVPPNAVAGGSGRSRLSDTRTRLFLNSHLDEAPIREVSVFRRSCRDAVCLPQRASAGSDVTSGGQHLSGHLQNGRVPEPRTWSSGSVEARGRIFGCRPRSKEEKQWVLRGMTVERPPRVTAVVSDLAAVGLANRSESITRT
jgi:hypothetical protein